MPTERSSGLPWSLVARLGGEAGRKDNKMLLLSARYLAPVTSDSVVEGSRFVTAVFAQMGAALAAGRRSARPIKMNCLLIQIDV